MTPEPERTTTGEGRGRRILLRAVYWVAVLAVSLALLVLLILLLESRDDSSVNGVISPALRS